MCTNETGHIIQRVCKSPRTHRPSSCVRAGVHAAGSASEHFDLFECRAHLHGHKSAMHCLSQRRVCALASREPYRCFFFLFGRWSLGAGTIWDRRFLLLIEPLPLLCLRARLIYARGQRGRPRSVGPLVAAVAAARLQQPPSICCSFCHFCPNCQHVRRLPARPFARHLQICTRINQLDERNFLLRLPAPHTYLHTLTWHTITPLKGCE